jgi:1-acyl-sn-glycerol-3-phosphate acyltransferase
VNKPGVLKTNGPLLLAANHPNSFLDGMIVTTLFDQPVHSLARGDVFKNKWINKFLHRIQLLPVYRTSEGVENLEHNYTTFAACQKTFEENGIVLIFSEGRCENEWHLRPLKKGTARLAVSSWQKGIPLKVIPLALNYSSFKKFGKDVHLFFGEAIGPDAIDRNASHGKQLLDFNTLLKAQLQEAVYEIDDQDKAKAKQIFSIKKDNSFYPLLLPAAVGLVLHAPVYYLCKALTEIRFRHSGHYDSVLTSLLIVSYPFYWLLLVAAAYSIQPLWGIILLPIMPFTAWAAVQIKYQLGM